MPHRPPARPLVRLPVVLLVLALLSAGVVPLAVPPAAAGQSDGDGSGTGSGDTSSTTLARSATADGPATVLVVTVASDADGSPSLDDGFELSAVPTFAPSATLTFTVALRNPGAEPAVHTLGAAAADRAFTFAVQDVFGRDLEPTWTVAPDVAPGETVTVPAQGEVELGTATWQPADAFQAWGSVVADHRARAVAPLDDAGELTADRRFRVEQPGLTVDAYGLSAFVAGAGLDVYFSGQSVPVRLDNVGETTLTGDLAFTVRGPHGTVARSEPRPVALAPGGTAEASWDQTDDAGAAVPAGTYLVRAQVTTADGARRFDEYPVTLHRGPQVTPVPSIATDRPAYAPGETVRFTVALTNPNPDPVTLEFTSGQEVDVLVTRPDGTLWRWSDDKRFIQALHDRTLAPGERATWTVEGSVDQPGAHRAVGVVTARHRLETALPAVFHVGADGVPPEPPRTCVGSEATALSLSLTDAAGRSRTGFAAGEPVHVHLVNTGDRPFSGGATMTVSAAADGTGLHRQTMPADRLLRPGQAWTFVWDQTGADGSQVPDGRYLARVATDGGAVGFGFDVGQATDGAGSGTGSGTGTATTGGSAGGTIAGSSFACTFTVPTYYYALDVRTDATVYPVNETVGVTYRAPQDLKGTVRFAVLDADRRVVHEAAVRLNTTLPAGEAARFAWDQTDADGAQVDEGFFVARVEAAGFAGDAPFFVGTLGPVPPGVAVPYDVLDPTTPTPQPAWDDAALAGASEAYGQAFLRSFLQPAADREARLDAARARGLHGAFAYDGRVAEGSYVSFSYDEATGRVTAYSVAPDGGVPRPLFSSVAVRPFEPSPSGSLSGAGGVEAAGAGAGADDPARRTRSPLANPLVAGPGFVHLGEGAMVNAVDVPEGPLIVRTATARQVDLVLAEGLAARVEVPSAGESGNCVRVEGDLLARICVLGGGEVRVAGNVVSVDLDAGSQLAAATVPAGALPERTAALTEGVADGRVGATVALSDADAAQPVLYQPGFSRIASRALTQDGQRVGVEVTVDRSLPDGTVLVLRLGPEVLNVTRPEDVGLTLDGEPVPRATGVRSVLNPAEPARPAYVVAIGDGGVVELLVHVPHFSERTLAIQDLALLADEPAFRLALTQAALVAVVITLAAAVAVFRGKGEE